MSAGTPAAGLRVLMVAPFPRGREQGGSQRATAVAERLEERGATVDWREIDPVPRSALAKAASMVRLRPGFVALYPSPQPLDPAPWASAIAAHSFLAPQLDTLPAGVIRVTDFHNLEWQHLADSAGPAPAGARLRAAVRSVYRVAQIRLLERFERRVVGNSDLALFVSPGELAWAAERAPRGSTLLVPSVLPRATAAAAGRVATRRQPDGDRRLLYVGTLSFPPNVLALRRFLDGPWPEIRRALPEATLDVAGGLDGALRAELSGRPGVRVLGYVEDLAPLLERATVAVMPFEGRAGTSLRALHYALAAVPVVGSPGAFRGLEPEFGRPAHTTREWLAGLAAAAADPTADRARRAAQLRQDDPGPWDALARALSRQR